jgi:hypothetical protein
MPDVDSISSKLCEIVELKVPDQYGTYSVSSKSEFLTASLKKSKNINDARLLQYFFRVIVAHVPRFETCFLIASDVFAKTDFYFPSSMDAHRHRLFVFRQLLHKYMPKTARALLEMNGLEDRHLNTMFVGFFTTLLPERQVLQMIDAFLLEGWRILVRFGLALIKVHKREIKSGRFADGDSFWGHLQAQIEVLEITGRNTLISQRRGSLSNAVEVEVAEAERIMRAYPNIAAVAYEEGRSTMAKMYRYPALMSHPKAY